MSPFWISVGMGKHSFGTCDEGIVVFGFQCDRVQVVGHVAVGEYMSNIVLLVAMHKRI